MNKQAQTITQRVAQALTLSGLKVTIAEELTMELDGCIYVGDKVDGGITNVQVGERYVAVHRWYAERGTQYDFGKETRSLKKCLRWIEEANAHRAA